MEVNRLFDLLPRYKELCPGKEDALAGKEDGVWKKYSTDQFIENSNDLSYGFIKLGVKKGDKIASITFNMPDWNILDMALYQIGAIHIPIYPTISDTDYKYILQHAEIKYLFVAGKDLHRRINHLVAGIPTIKEIFTFKNLSGVRHLDELIKLGKNDPKPSKLEKIKKSIDPEDIATIIYTSGTTGTPKGVVLSHKNILSNVHAVSYIPPFGPEHHALSFLPICHIYERTMNYILLYKGLSMYYVSNIAEVANHLKEINPYVMTTVPRLLEKIYDKIMAKGMALKGIKRQIFLWAHNLGMKYDIGREKEIIYGIKLKIARKLVFSKWKAVFGTNLDIIVSGGAALQPRLNRIFWAVGLRILEGYGLTETSPVIAVNNFDPKGVKFGTVGPVLNNLQVKIANDGEILVKGPSVMQEYYKAPELTAEVFDEEGWFHTGDVGLITPEGQLKITDRKKMIFKTSFGKYVSPQLIEDKLKESPFIDHIMVIGSNQKFPAALIVPNFEHLKTWCEINDIKYTTNNEMVDNKNIKKQIDEDIKNHNQSLGEYERIKKYVLLDHEWSVENGHLSATLKVRRSHLSKKYENIINDIYNDGN